MIEVLDRRAPWIAALAVLVAALLTMSPDPIGVFYDDGIYVLTGKALAEGRGYVYPMLPGNLPAIHYPPLWPAVIAAVWKVAPEFPGNVAWLKLVNPVMLAAAAAGAVVFARRQLGFDWRLALPLALLGTIAVPTLLLTALLLSEPIFLALLFPALLVSEKLCREGGWRLAMLAAVLGAALVLTRTIGGVFLVATVLVLALDRRWRELGLYVVVAFVLLLPWQLLVWRVSPGFPDELRGSYGPYLEWVVDGYRTGGLPFVRAVVAKNLVDIWVMVGVFASPVLRGVARHAAAGFAFALLAAGMVQLWTDGRARVTALALLGYLTVVIAWPYQVERFAWAAWPLLVLVTAAGGIGLWRMLAARGRPRLALAAAALTVVLGLGNLTYNARGLARGWASSATRPMADRFLAVVRYINSDPRLDGRVIASEVPPIVGLYTGRTTVPVEILTPQQHVRPKTPQEHAETIARIDRAFLPGAYVLIPGGVHEIALREAALDPSRRLVDISPPGAAVRAFLVEPR